MKEERMKILELLQSGIINAEEAAKLLQAIEVDGNNLDDLDANDNLAIKTVKKTAKRKMLKILVNSNDGDNVNIQIPIEFAKLLKTMNLDKKMADSDITINIDDILSMIDEGVIGELVNIHSADGDIVKIIIE